MNKELTKEYLVFNKAMTALILEVDSSIVDSLRNIINDYVKSHAAHQSVEFAKWKEGNAFMLDARTPEQLYDIIGHNAHLPQFNLQELYQYWYQNIYLKEQGA